MTNKRNILISIPGKSGSSVYLPTIWGILKTYCEKSAIVREGYEWLDPIVVKRSVDEMLAPYRDQRIDVLGLSCYCWNTLSNFALAREVKRQHPECLVIAGGPDPDYRQPGFFREHPFIDAVVLSDGEYPFRVILEALHQGRLDLEQVPSLVLPPGDEERGPRNTPPQERFDDFDYQPWLATDDYYQRTFDSLRGPQRQTRLIISWETDRGCPYKCSFCDWGSATYSKVRAIGMDRLAKEAEWIGRNQIEVVSFTSANFGILPRDVEILELLIEAKRRYGYPKEVQWNNAKNNTTRVIEINRRAFAAGLVNFHTLSVQSLDDDVLRAMDRSNIKPRKQLEILETLRSDDIPSVVQLIYGGPNDTLDRFQATLTTLMEWGIHDEFVCYPFLVLPNAPANAPSYRKAWGIETIERYGSVNRRSRQTPLRDGSDRYSFIVSSSSYSRDEYAEMYVFGRMIIALHNAGPTQHLARYLRAVRGVPYKDFYVRLWEHFCARADTLLGETLHTSLSHIRRFVAEGGDDLLEQIAPQELPEYGALLHIEEYAMFRVLSQADRFFAECAEWLAGWQDVDEEVQSLLEFSRAVLITPDYDAREGRTLRLDYHWPEFFAAGDRTADSLPTAVAPASPPRTLHIDRRTSGPHRDKPLDWRSDPNDTRPLLCRWLDATIGSEYTRVQRTYFANLHLDDEPRDAAGHAGAGLGT